MLDLGQTVQVAIVREPKASQAKFTVSSDVAVKGEFKQREHFTGMESTGPSKTAYKFFKQAILLLGKRDLKCQDIRLENLPKLPRDIAHFRAEATIEVGERSDDELRAIFEQEMYIAKTIAQEADFTQRRGKGRNWTNRKGGRAAGL